MLLLDQIKEYFPAELARLNPKGLLVEYLQHEFLDSLFKEKGAEKLSFIGGTAIRIISNSQGFNYKQLSNEVLPFLFNGDQQARVLNFKENLDQILSGNVAPT